MFGIGMQEIIVILVLALIVIGPKKLPEVAKALGKGYGEFRRAFEDMRSSINSDINADTKASDEAEKLKDLNDRFPPPLQKPAAADEKEDDIPVDAAADAPEPAAADPYAGQEDLPVHEPMEEEVEEEHLDRT